MLLSVLRSWRRGRAAEASKGCTACPLAACARGCRAAVIRIECGSDEAQQLRYLGLYEGSCVTVIDRQDGYLLDVCGSRLALGARLANAITVLPIGG